MRSFAFGLVLSTTAFATAATVPFTEPFAADAAGWFNSANSAPLSWSAAGGPDGSAYVSESFNFVSSIPGPQGPVLFRGQDEHNASNHNFEGNWISDGVSEFRASVRHDAPVAVNFFVRFASPANFPGASGVVFAPIAPNTWTDISIAIDPLNPQFVSFEGTDFNSVFSNIGHVQVGVLVPAALAGVDHAYRFDFDAPTIVPEPTVVAGVLAVFALGLRRR